MDRFLGKGGLKKVALAGEGPVTTLCDTPAIFGASWGSDDTIIFDRITGGLWEVSAAGGMPKSVTTVDAGKGEFSHRLPRSFPPTKPLYSRSRLHSCLPGTTPRLSCNLSSQTSARFLSTAAQTELITDRPSPLCPPWRTVSRAVQPADACSDRRRHQCDQRRHAIG